MSINEDKQRILLTGGRAPATLDLARQWAANGHKVFMAESCPSHLCVRSNAIVKNYSVCKPNEHPDEYILQLAKVVEEEEIDWIVPTCEEIFYVSQGLQTLSKTCRVFVDSFDKLKRLHSKWNFIKAVTEAGMPHVPSTYLLQTPEDVERMLAMPGVWVFKREYSRFSAKVFIVNNEDDTVIPKQMTKEKILSLLSRDMQAASGRSLWVAQQFIRGASFCSYSTSVDGRLTAHAVYPVEFTAGSGACINFQSVHHPGIDNWVKRFAEVEQFTGQIAFDFIVTVDGSIYPIECNPRATSGIHLFRADDRLDQAFFQKKVNQVLKPQKENKAMLAAAMLTYGFLQIRTWPLARKWIQVLIQSRDIMFQPKDPLPFFQQFLLLWENFKISRRKNISIMEATTVDIEWNGETE